MFRPLICIVALGLTSALHAEDRQSIETQSAAVVEAIKQGQFGSRFSDQVKLSSSQIVEISKLKGCTPERTGPQGLWLVEVNWHCAKDASYSGYSIATSWLFNEKSELIGLAINPIIEGLRPSHKVVEDKSPEPNSIFAKRFAEAVVSGDDVTLSGYMTFSQYELERLAMLAGGEYSVSISGPNGARSIKFWDDDNMLHRTQMHFDEEGRAIGLTFKPGQERDSAGSQAASDRDSSRDRLETGELTDRNRDSVLRNNRGLERNRTRQLCPSC